VKGWRVDWQWLWGVLATTAIGVIGWLVSRSAKSYADDAVEPVKQRVTDIEKDLLRNYVTHSQLDELKKMNERLLKSVTALRIALARKFKLAIPEDHEDDEN
jgi:hypothetical protein